MYHRLVTREQHDLIIGPERLYSLPSPEFERQVRWLQRAGYSFIGPAEVMQVVRGVRTPTGPEVMITFDDGCRSVWLRAKPILERYGVPAVVFVTTDSNSTVFASGASDQARMTDDELRALVKAGIEVQSHTVTHRSLVRLPEDEVEMELIQSRKDLEHIGGAAVRYLSIPGNWFDQRILLKARSCGYEGVWCSNPGRVRAAVTTAAVPRLNVDGDLSLRQFAWAISSTGLVWSRILTGVKRLVKWCAGQSGWMICRRRVLSLMPGAHLSKRRVLRLTLAAVCTVAGVALVILVMTLLRNG